MTRRKLIILILVVVVSLLIVAIASIAGYLAGLALTGQITSGAFEQWQSLGTPPQKASKILKADTLHVYIATAQNEVYDCQVSSKNDCWVASPIANDNLQTLNSYCASSPSYQTATSPGKVIDSLETKSCFIEGATQRNYAILEDGSVWTWTHGGGTGNIGVGFICTGLGSLVGFVVGIVLAVAVSKAIWHRVRSVDYAEQ